MILSRRTSAQEVDILSEELITDLVAAFRMMRDDVLLLINQAAEEKWSDSKLENELTKLFDGEPDEHQIQ